jgi:hypothetical protein
MVINATINQTLNITAGIAKAYTGNVYADSAIRYFDATIIPRLTDIVTAPAQHPNMIWIVVPLVAAVVLMQLYFGRNPTEKLGWNTAFGNSVALIFVSVNLLNHLYMTFGWTAFEIAWQSRTLKTVIALGVGVIGIFGMFLDLFHWLPERVAFFLGGAIPINLTAYMAIVLVYSDYVPIDRVTFFTALFFFAVLLVVFWIFKLIVPKSRQAKEEIRKMREARKKKRLEKRMLKLKKKAELQNL